MYLFMKKLTSTLVKKVLTLFFGLFFLFVLVTSCGSTWNIEGNNMFIQKVDRDTIAPAGTFIFYPDSSLIPHK